MRAISNLARCPGPVVSWRFKGNDLIDQQRNEFSHGRIVSFAHSFSIATEISKTTDENTISRYHRKRDDFNKFYNVFELIRRKPVFLNDFLNMTLIG